MTSFMIAHIKKKELCLSGTFNVCSAFHRKHQLEISEAVIKVQPLFFQSYRLLNIFSRNCVVRLVANTGFNKSLMCSGIG